MNRPFNVIGFHQLFEQQVQQTPEQVAVSFETESLTYQQLNQRANQVAHLLQQLGVGPEVLVGIGVERSLDLLVGLLGILKAGGAYVPLDPAHPRERLAYMLEDAVVSVLLTQSHLVDTFELDTSTHLICLDRDWPEISQQPQENPITQLHANNLAYVIYTSGSTGKPKGVQITHRSVINFLQSMQECPGLTAEDILLAVTTITFDIAVLELFLPLSVGAQTLIVSREVATDGHHLSQLLLSAGVTFMQATPATWQMLIKAGWRGIKDHKPDRPLKLLCGGEALSRELANQLLERCTSLWNVYGPTETTIWSTISPVQAGTHVISLGDPIANTQLYLLNEQMQPVAPGEIGELYIGGAGLARGYLNRPDLTAERFITNTLLAAEEIAEPSSHSSLVTRHSSLLYKTGDLVRYLPDGTLQYLGRSDFQVKIRGFRIELGEIEAALRQHPSVEQAVVVAREDRPGDQKLVAYLICTLLPERVPYQTEVTAEVNGTLISLQTEDISSTGVGLVGVPAGWKSDQVIRLQLQLPESSEPQWFEGRLAWHRSKRAGVEFSLNSTQEVMLHQSIEQLLETQGLLKVLQRTVTRNLRNFLKKQLPEYMIPAYFVLLKTLPLTPNGKIDRQQLPTPEYHREQSSQDWVAPQSPTEQTVANIWADVLGIEQPGIHDHFLELGGHSLLATQILSRIREQYQVELTLGCIFEAATIAGLAQRIETARQAPLSVSPVSFEILENRHQIPLSFAQARLWFFEQLMPNHAFYNVYEALHLSGSLNIEALEQSFNEMIRRHEMLRTTFATVAGEPVQVIHPPTPLKPSYLSLQTLPEAERLTQVKTLTTHQIQQPFDITELPLVRVSVWQLKEDEYILLIVLHHLLCDEWSMGVLFEELGLLYQAYLHYQSPALPKLPAQYGDFAVWQRQWLSGEVESLQLAYWQQQLANLPVLQLPTDHPRPAVPSYRGARHFLSFSSSLTAGLTSLSQKQGVTLFMTLLAAFQTLLYRYTGSEDIPIGTAIANRHQHQVEGVIGFFANTLVLRTDLSGNPTFEALLKRVREVALAAYTYQDLPFEKVVAQVQPDRDLSRQPLFQAVFSLQNFGVIDELHFPGLQTTPVQLDNQTAKFDLFLQLTKTPEGLTGYFEYSTDLFEPATIQRFAGHLETLLTGIVAKPDTPISKLPILTDAEQYHLLELFRATPQFSTTWALDEASSFPPSLCIHHLFEAQVERTPDAIALVFAGDDAPPPLTYQQLNEQANQLAHHLKGLGVGPETFVGLCVERSFGAIIGILGILKAGGAYIPLDPAYPSERLAFMIEDAGMPVLLTQAHLLTNLLEYGVPVICLDAGWKTMARHPKTNLITEVTPQNLAYIIYTSGSTGQPKGVMIQHQGLVNLAQCQQQIFGIDANSRLIQFASLSFDASVSEIFMALSAGATLVLSNRDQLLPGFPLLQVLQNYQITTITLPPSALAVLPTADLPALRTLIVAGEASSAELIRHWISGRRIFNAYGPTEATVCTTIAECVGDERKPPIGRPIPNTQCLLLDAHRNPVPLGVPGELYISGIGLARGYLNRPDLTAERFIPNPLTETEKIKELSSHLAIVSRRTSLLYKTGDLARYLPDGNLEFLGRIDQQVKIRGFRVEPEEISTVLRRHPQVQDAIVIDREDVAGDKRLVAYVVPKHQSTTALQPELWPSISEYYVYDELLYYAMTHDERRNHSYQVAINQLVKDKVVVDIGTGRDAILARFCAEAGAKKVYAIELLEESYQHAKQCLKELGLDDIITLIHGNSTQVELPEKVDVCVSEIVGAIGGSEGGALILNDARRFLKEDGIMIPLKSVTKIAAVYLPDQLAENPQFVPIGSHYTRKIFEQVGHEFDLRVCIKNFPQSNVISNADIFENLDFTQPLSSEYQRSIRLEIQKAGKIDGFLVWLTLETITGEIIDILQASYCWIPVYLPVFDPGVEVYAGDVIEATVRGIFCENGLNLDYQVQGILQRQKGESIAFDYTSVHLQSVFKQTPFYQRLFSKQSPPTLRSETQNLQRSHIAQWQALYEETHKQLENSDTAITSNFVGWNSSYTGLPISDTQMQEWVHYTVERILALKPNRVLEIGCGAGLLLFPIAPHCSEYVGMDFSQEVLNYLEQQLEQYEPALPQVKLLHRSADNFAGIEAQSFDTVIINSVIQYFPNIDYLLEVIENAINAVKPGGHIFIGDIRSLPLLEAFHASVTLHQASPSLTSEQLRQRWQQRLTQEEELVIDPVFFRLIQQHFSQVGHVQIQLKRGRFQTELTRFRYDVVLHIGEPVELSTDIVWLDWQPTHTNLDSIRQLLLETQPEVLGIRGVPNARVHTEMETLNWLKNGEHSQTVDEYFERLQEQLTIGIEPEDFWHFSQECPYDIQVTWSDSTNANCYDVVFKHHSVEAMVAYWENTLPSQPWHAYANDPLQGKTMRQLVPELRKFLQERLPEYMIPASFVLMNRLPLTVNGKVDRQQLPAPHYTPTIGAENFVAPRTPLEQDIADIYAQVLNIPKVSVRDSFFEIGGNSLLATQLIARVRLVCRQELPIRCLFEKPTVEGLAESVEAMRHAGVAGVTTQVNLFSEAVLDADIDPLTPNQEVTDTPTHIFLTGATGFLGAFLLSELLKNTQATLYCLVRAGTIQEASSRLQQILEKYHIWQPDQASRIIPVLGNLEQPHLGIDPEHYQQLCDKIDWIYHSGAQVNFAKPYSVLKASNVLGTQEILRLAVQKKLKLVHYISTCGIFGPFTHFLGTCSVKEDENIDFVEPYMYYDNGYAQTKWVAEKLVWSAKSRGVPVKVYRPGFIMGQSQTGVANTNDYISRLIKGCMQINCFPDLKEQREEMISVDYVSQAIVQISLQRTSIGEAFHLVPLPEHNMDLIELFELINAWGYQVQKVPYSQWEKALLEQMVFSTENALYPLIPVLTEKIYQSLTILELYQNTPHYECENTRKALAGIDIKYSPLNADTLNTYLTYYVQSGFIEAPKIKMS
jgi:amino acid adenylation domain-containing protein/thioester reductase-like protein